MHTFFPFSILTLVRLHPLPPTRLLLVMEQSGAAGNWKSILVSNPRNILGLTKKRSWPLFNREEAPSWCKEESSLTSPYLRALIISFLHRAIRFALFRAALNRIPPPIPPLLHAAPSWKSGDREKGRKGTKKGVGGQELGWIFYFYRRHFFLLQGKIEFVFSFEDGNRAVSLSRTKIDAVSSTPFVQSFVILDFLLDRTISFV